MELIDKLQVIREFLEFCFESGIRISDVTGYPFPPRELGSVEVMERYSTWECNRLRKERA